MSSSQTRTERQLDAILAQPGNNQCADCHAMAPRWASINLGIFLCVQCASIHRSLGTHTSRVKSLTMDTWTRETVEHMRAWGNVKANAVWNPDEGRNPVPVSVGEEGRQGEMERYIRNKYERGLFRGDREVREMREVKETRAFGNGVGAGRQDVGRETRAFGNGIGNGRDAPRRPSLEEIYDEPRRHAEYAYEPTNITKKKKATRAHVDANWADFIDGTTPSEDYEDRPTSSGSRKAGRLLGLPDGDRGAVRLPPVTKAPRGLVYKREGEERPPPPVPSKTKSPEPQRQPEPRPQPPTAPIVAPDLVNLNDSIHVPAPYQVASTSNGQAPPMQRMFHQPPQPMPSPGYNAYNPFLNPTFQQPLQSPQTGYFHPTSANGTGYPNPMQGPFTPTPAFPFQQQQHLQQPFYSPGPASAGGYFANAQGQAQQMGNPFFAQQQQQGTGYGGWSR